MPYYSSLNVLDWPRIYKKLDLEFISPYWEIDKVLTKIQGCSKTITEAMHGAIVADALRVPWCAISFAPKFLPSMWLDWCSAINIELKIIPIPFVNKQTSHKGKLLEWRFKRALAKVGLAKKK